MGHWYFSVFSLKLRSQLFLGFESSSVQTGICTISCPGSPAHQLQIWGFLICHICMSQIWMSQLLMINLYIYISSVSLENLSNNIYLLLYKKKGSDTIRTLNKTINAYRKYTGILSVFWFLTSRRADLKE